MITALVGTSLYAFEGHIEVAHAALVGLPATVEHGGGRSATSNSSAAVVAEITAAFITCLDSVRLNMLAVDQVLTPLPACRSCKVCHARHIVLQIQ